MYLTNTILHKTNYCKLKVTSDNFLNELSGKYKIFRAELPKLKSTIT